MFEIISSHYSFREGANHTLKRRLPPLRS